MRSLPFLALVLTLTACDSQADPVSEVPTATPASDELGDGTDYGAGISTDPIPAQFHGVWDVPGGSCEPASEQRVEIEARRILFYESVGTVMGTTEEDDRIVAGLSMEGEGEGWTTRYMLALGGDRLSMEDIDLREGGNAIVRVRCPG